MSEASKKFTKQVSSELKSLGITTKSVSSEDGSSMSARSADELKTLRDLIAQEDLIGSARNKARFVSTRPPGAY